SKWILRRKVEVVLPPVLAHDPGIECEGAILREIADVAFPERILSDVVIPGDNLHVPETLLEAFAPRLLRRVGVPGIPAVAQIPQGEHEVRFRHLELGQAFAEAAP